MQINCKIQIYYLKPIKTYIVAPIQGESYLISENIEIIGLKELLKKID